MSALPEHFPGIDEDFLPHPFAETFPMEVLEDLWKLADSIYKLGQLMPVLIYQGLILDGRNRYAAISLLNRKLQSEGKPPIALIYGIYGGGEESLLIERQALDFVKVANLDRRQLTVGQKAVVAIELQRHYAAIEEKEKTQSLLISVTNSSPVVSRELREKVGKELGISGGSMMQVNVIAKNNPELLEDVKNGKKTLNAAYRETNPIIREVSNAAESDFVEDFLVNIHSYDDDEIIEILNIIHANHRSTFTHWLSKINDLKPCKIEALDCA